MDSSPINNPRHPLSAARRNSSSSAAMFNEAWLNQYFFTGFNCRNNSFAYWKLPAILSSTKEMILPGRLFTSLITSVTGRNLYVRPKKLETAQKEQENGQPRVVCTVCGTR